MAVISRAPAPASLSGLSLGLAALLCSLAVADLGHAAGEPGPGRAGFKAPSGARQEPGPAELGQASDAAGTVERLIAAFNRADAEAMAALVSADLELFYVGGDGRAVIGAQGRESFLEQMEQYFAAYPGVRSEAENLIPGPAFVAYRERIVEGPGAGQSSIAVYEVRDGTVRRAWYYPAEAPDKP